MIHISIDISVITTNQQPGNRADLLFLEKTTLPKLQFGKWTCLKYRQNYTNWNYDR